MMMLSPLIVDSTLNSSSLQFLLLYVWRTAVLYCVVFLSCCKCTNKENDFVSCSYQFKDSNAYHSLFEREKDNDPGRSILNTDSIIICLDNRRSGSIFGLS